MDIARRRYSAIRTDRDNRELLLKELRPGRLRPGWGNDASQDLRVSAISRGERLTEKQQEVLLYLKMLSTAEDGVQIGDWVLAPNLPEDGSFMIAEGHELEREPDQCAGDQIGRGQKAPGAAADKVILLRSS